jgi:flagella basal body P-ring formation protein FlgA
MRISRLARMRRLLTVPGVKYRLFARCARLFVIPFALAVQAGATQAQSAPAESVRAQVSSAEVAQALALARQAAAARAPAGARIEAEALPLDPRLHLAPCARVLPQLQAGAPAWGRTHVGLRCTEGARWNVSLPVQVRVHAPAWVARSALPAGTRLAQDLLARADVEWSAAALPPLAQVHELIGRVLVRPLAAGQAPRAADLQARQWFASGERVRLVAQGSGFSISTDGEALNAGIEGQPVRVRMDSGRIVVGRAVAQGRVELAL